jgi:exopolysaccharide production protein ExoQ
LNNYSLSRDIRRLPSLGEKSFTVLVLLMSTGAFMCLATMPGQASDDSPGVIGKLVALSIYLITFLLLARHCKGLLTTIARERFVFALVCLAVFSAFWSDNPSLSFRRGASLVATSLFGVYFSSRYELREQIKLLACMCGISILFSFIFGLLGVGHSGDGAPGWFGIYDQKNELGRVMVLSSLVFWFLARIDPKHRWLGRIGTLLSFALIVLAKSQTALISFSLLIVLQVTLDAFRHSLRRGLAILCQAIVAAGVLINWSLTHMQATADTLGRSVTLTGRLTIWILAVAMALKRPWLGYGYNAFWQGLGGPSARVWGALNWGTPHAHNGFLDLWLGLGLVGLTVFGIGFVVYVRRAFYFLSHASPESSWPLMFLGFFFLYNLTESTLAVANTVFWALYAATAFTLFAAAERTAASVRVGARNQRVAYSVS